MSGRGSVRDVPLTKERSGESRVGICVLSHDGTSLGVLTEFVPKH